jgi:surface antigen
LSNILKTVVLIVVGLASASAEAQILGWTWESNITLNQDDLNMIHQTVDQQFHGKPVGTTASWNNPTSNNSGTIKLLSKYRSRNMQCKRIQYTLRTTARNVSPEHYVLNSCLTPEGWRIA